MEQGNWIEMMEKMQDIRRFCSLYIKRTKKGEISSAQELDLLSRVALSEEKVTPRHLCSVMGINKSLLSRLIEGLEKKGFVEKEMSIQDKRSYFLKITQKGNMELKETYEYYLKPIYELRRNIGEEKFKELIYLIRESNRNMEK